jgi:colanic acid/amylovoran biosynthesis glycosyltransferase
VHVFARVPAEAPIHADFERYRLAERTHYWWGTGQAGPLTRRTLRLLRGRPRGAAAVMLRASNPLRHGSYSLVGRHWAYASTLLDHGPFDVVLAQFGTNGRIAEKLRRMGAFEAPLATIWLGYDLTRILREKGPSHYRELFARGELQLPLSECFRQKLLAAGCPSDRIVVHHLGVDAARFDFVPRHIVHGERPRIVTVGRFVEKKGLEFALHALARVRALEIPFEYHLVGSGPLEERIVALTRELGLSEVVTMHGPRTREQVKPILARSHLFLAPSVTAPDGDQEGTPAAIMEAMASGLPVLSTLHSGIPEVVRDGETGFLVPEHDINALSSRIQELLCTPERWPSMGQAGRSVIEREFDVAKLNDRLSRMLEEVAREERGRSALRRELPVSSST